MWIKFAACNCTLEECIPVVIQLYGLTERYMSREPRASAFKPSKRTLDL